MNLFVGETVEFSETILFTVQFIKFKSGQAAPFQQKTHIHVKQNTVLRFPLISSQYVDILTASTIIVARLLQVRLLVHGQHQGS